MPEHQTDAPSTPENPTSEPPAAAATPDQPAPPAAPSGDGDKGGNPWDNPDAARAEIERLRRENGAARTNAKQQAAEQARQELAQQIGKTLGLVAEDQPLDPAQLTQELSAERQAAQQARVELAVFRAAGAAGGDPAALLDSTSFLRSLDGVDPTDSEAIAAAVASAVEANPRLGAAKEPRIPAPLPSQGASAAGPGSAAQLTEDQVKRLYADGKYDEIVKARNEGRLSSYLGAS